MKVSFKSQNMGTLKINDSKFVNCCGDYNPTAEKLLSNHMCSKYFYRNMVINSPRKSLLNILYLHFNFMLLVCCFKIEYN